MRLRAGDPVPLVFERPPSPLSEIAVWASVILSFADLTVWPEEVVTSRRSPVPRPSQAARPEGVPAGARDHGFRASEDDTRRVSGVSLGECCRRISLSLIADGFPTDLRRVRKRLKRRRRSGFDSLRAKNMGLRSCPRGQKRRGPREHHRLAPAPRTPNPFASVESKRRSGSFSRAACRTRLGCVPPSSGGWTEGEVEPAHTRNQPKAASWMRPSPNGLQLLGRARVLASVGGNYANDYQETLPLPLERVYQTSSESNGIYARLSLRCGRRRCS